MPDDLYSTILYMAAAVVLLLVTAFCYASIARLVFRHYFKEKEKYLKRSLDLTAPADPKEDQ